MKINKFNSEGYYDPTAYGALMAIEQEAKSGVSAIGIHLFSLAGNVEHNLSRQGVIWFPVMKGAIPIAPHLLFPQFMDDDDKTQRDLAIFMGLVLMGARKSGASVAGYPPAWL